MIGRESSVLEEAHRASEMLRQMNRLIFNEKRSSNHHMHEIQLCCFNAFDPD
jgi:hypothetical protein